jgi:predicted transposase/invertase (TIGR01784 family)
MPKGVKGEMERFLTLKVWRFQKLVVSLQRGEKAMEVEISEDMASKKDYWDYYSTMKTSFDKGMAEGMEKGLAEGKLIIARNLKDMHFSADDIAKATGLSAEQIEAL